MSIVIEHVKVSELPEGWRARLRTPGDARVTVRIEEEQERATPAVTEAPTTGDPAFGIWRDREDMADVEGYLRKLRAPRFTRD